MIDAGDAGKGQSRARGAEALQHATARLLYRVPIRIRITSEALQRSFQSVKVLNVIDNGLPPAGQPSPTPTPAPGNKPPAPAPKAPRAAEKSLKGTDHEVLRRIQGSGARKAGRNYETAEVGKKYDLGGGARLTCLDPSEPYFTKDQMKTGGNLPNANSIVVRLDYGDFSMLFAG